MLRIGHSVRGAVLILWGWAALIAFGSLTILFFKAQHVAFGMAIAVVVLTIATMYPYLKHRIPEIQEENATLEAARHNAQHATAVHDDVTPENTRSGSESLPVTGADSSGQENPS